MPDNRIKIKAVRKAPSRIKIRRKLLSASDIKNLTQSILKLNNYAPLHQSTIQDVFDKTSTYLKQFRVKSQSHIKIKKIKLYNKAN